MGKKFENVYIRCNLDCDGTIPEPGFHAGSPDMFSSGIEPLANFRTVLSTSESYKTLPEDKSTILRDNYCYLRCKNNTDKVISAKAQLFYTQAGLVLWPDMWTPMTVDFKQDTLNDIPDIPPGEIGVVERPFIWNKPKAPDTNGHYCYIGRLTTEETPNPIPSVEHPIDMSTLIKTNLMYAQRNIQIIDTDPGYNGSYRTVISAAKTLTKPSKYHLFFYSHDMAGWEAELTCSMTDSQGRKIGMARTKIINDDDIYCGQCVLEPGFHAVITVYLYSNGLTPKETSSTHVALEYAVQENELSLARERGVLDLPRSQRLMRRCGISDAGTAALTEMGDVSAVFRRIRPE